MQLLPLLPAALQLGLVQTVALAGPAVMKAFSTGGRPGGALISRQAHGRPGALARYETAAESGVSTRHGDLVGGGKLVGPGDASVLSVCCFPAFPGSFC